MPNLLVRRVHGPIVAEDAQALFDVFDCLVVDRVDFLQRGLADHVGDGALRFRHGVAQFRRGVADSSMSPGL